jgi:hypothetical protein
MSLGGDHFGQGLPRQQKDRFLAGNAAENARTGISIASLAYLMLKISERFCEGKETWHAEPAHHGVEDIPPPPPKKSCLDRMRNAPASTAARIRTGHWRSVVYLKRIRNRANDRCLFCNGSAKMTRSHVLLHSPNSGLRDGVGGEGPRGYPGAVSTSRAGEAGC